MITNESTEKRIFDAVKLKRGWLIRYEYHGVKHSESYEFLTVAQIRRMELEALGMRTSLEQI
jgi:hypothetical protein